MCIVPFGTRRRINIGSGRPLRDVRCVDSPRPRSPLGGGRRNIATSITQAVPTQQDRDINTWIYGCPSKRKICSGCSSTHPLIISSSVWAAVRSPPSNEDCRSLASSPIDNGYPMSRIPLVNNFRKEKQTLSRFSSTSVRRANGEFPAQRKSSTFGPITLCQFGPNSMRTPDLVLIDGRFRTACFFSCLFALPSTTKIAIHDFRDGYEVRKELREIA